MLVSNLLNGKSDSIQDVFRDMPNWLFKLLETGMALVGYMKFYPKNLVDQEGRWGYLFTHEW